MSQGLRIGIQILLGIIIVALAYWLYVSITEPYAVVEARREMTRLTRDRMDDIRQALVRFNREEGRFPSSLDSLVIWAQQDSVISANPDSFFGPGFAGFDSLLYSPRTGEPFVYTLNDTGRVDIYFLKDPDTEDHIGAQEPDPTQLNAASWE